MANEQPESRNDEVLGYQIVPIRKPKGVASAAFISCCKCSAPISSMGGPRENAYCLKCFASSESALIGKIVVERGLVRDSIGPITALPEGEYELRRVERGGGS